MANISDVAKRAGLSVATVSRVMNNHPYVSEEKRKAVMKAMEELSYTPSAAAQQMRGKARNRIGVIVPHITNPYFSYLVDSIEQTAFANNYEILILQSLEDPEREIQFLEMLNRKQVDGIIMCAVENPFEILKPYLDKGVIVLCNEELDEGNIPSIRVNQELGAYLGVKHLLNKGYQRVAFCTGGNYPDNDKGKDRVAGYKRALEEFNHEVNPNWIFSNQHSINDGKRVLQKILLFGKDAPDALFTGSDEIAAGVLLEARKQGLTVPDDLAVIGFDDQPLAELVYPALTTIRQPIEEIGRRAMEWMICLINKKALPKDEAELELALIVREST